MYAYCCVPPNPNFRHVTIITHLLLPRMHQQRTPGIVNCFAKMSKWMVNNDINLDVLYSYTLLLSMVLECVHALILHCKGALIICDIWVALVYKLFIAFLSNPHVFNTTMTPSTVSDWDVALDRDSPTCNVEC